VLNNREMGNVPDLFVAQSWALHSDETHNFCQKGAQKLEAYCVKCKAKKEIKNPTSTTMKNGKPATTGTCSTCGTKVFKIGKA